MNLPMGKKKDPDERGFKECMCQFSKGKSYYLTWGRLKYKAIAEQPASYWWSSKPARSTTRQNHLQLKYASPGPGVVFALAYQISSPYCFHALHHLWVPGTSVSFQLPSILYSFKKNWIKERKKKDNLHFLIQSQGLFIIACTSLIKMINECIVTEP